ncbi:MAG: HEAT repeat domain-containing protein [Planctomycetota bacterium]|nr:HEAT repeat domain-containing protein [Planctomycetota bacterium]
MIHDTNRLSILAIALAVFCAPASSQNEAAAIKTFRQDFKPKASAIAMKKAVLSFNPNSPPYRAELNRRNEVYQRWASAARGLQGHSSEAIARLVATSWTQIDKEVGGLWKRHAKLEKKVDSNYDKLLKANGGKPIGPGRVRVPGKVISAQQVWLASCRESSELQRDITDLSSLQDELREVVKAMRTPVGPRWLLESVVGQKKYPMLLKVSAIQSATAIGESMIAPLTTILDKANKPDVLAAALFGIGIFGAKAKASAPKILPLLDHPDSGVRERAALALQHMKEGAAIEPMIKLITRESGQARLRIVAALEILTGKQFGSNISAWQGWFAREGADYAANKKPLGTGRPSQHRKFDEKNYYYGIPQQGKGIIYVIDCSGSMIVDKDRPRWGDPSGMRLPEPPDDPSNSRSEASKRELVRALTGLSSDQVFNIISYNHSATLFKKAMIHATPKNIKAATKYVRTLPADSSTNIYDAMNLAFTLTGRGSYDKHYDVAFDTIFLMTDGKPTLQGIGDDDPMNIIRGVRQWNALKRVVIHTIAMGEDGIDHRFMRMLAQENSGSYRRIMKGGKVVRDGAKDENAKAGKGKGGGK